MAPCNRASGPRARWRTGCEPARHAVSYALSWARAALAAVTMLVREASTSGQPRVLRPQSGLIQSWAGSMTSAALGTLYIQILSLVVILFVYHAAVTPVTIENAGGAFVALVFAWLSGFAIGVVFYAMKPWAPKFVEIFSMVYTRANMIASGKMFLANQLPGFMLAMFDWNPLFHLIDQARGFTFINYNPHFTSMSYPIYVTLGILMIGLMGEFYTRRNSSAGMSSVERAAPLVLLSVMSRLVRWMLRAYQPQARRRPAMRGPPSRYRRRQLIPGATTYCSTGCTRRRTMSPSVCVTQDAAYSRTSSAP